MGHNSNIFLTFTDELEKQIEVGQKKLIFTLLQPQKPRNQNFEKIA